MEKLHYYNGVFPTDHPSSNVWFLEAVSSLLYDQGRRYDLSNLTFGVDRQYDRTIDENGEPGEYLQVWMKYDDYEEEVT